MDGSAAPIEQFACILRRWSFYTSQVYFGRFRIQERLFQMASSTTACIGAPLVGARSSFRAVTALTAHPKIPDQLEICPDNSVVFHRAPA